MVPHRLRKLETWSPVGGAVWQDGAILLEEIPRWVKSLRVHSLVPLPVWFLCFVFAVGSSFLLHTACLALADMTDLFFNSRNTDPSKLFFHKLLWSWYIITVTEKLLLRLSIQTHGCKHPSLSLCVCVVSRVNTILLQHCLFKNTVC